MNLGYNTNGLAHHRILDAIDLLADVGYQSVAITLDAGELDPFQNAQSFRKTLRLARARLETRNMRCVVETGARYLLNPKKKHDPTLLDPDDSRRQVRIAFLRTAVEAAHLLGAPVVSLWSGALPSAETAETAFDRLVNSLRVVLDDAAQHAVNVGFEPEPGMFIDTNARFAQLLERLPHPNLKMTLDLGHVHCIEDGSVADHVAAWGPHIVNVHIEDMARAVHEHLPFGQGTMDFPPILKALKDVHYTGGLHVELSRDSHRAVEAVCHSYNFLAPLLGAL